MKTESASMKVTDVSIAEKEREFDFNDNDFDRICKLIYEHAGISLSKQKRDMVYSRVARRLRATGLTSFENYLAHLENSGPDELQAFTNSLTTNLTSFFREPHHFPILAEHISHQKHRPISIWCSAASTGEEPYSLAITMAELFGTLSPPVKILASDLDTNVLDQADRGVYADERVEKMEQSRVQRFFLRGSGANAGRVKVRPELRQLIVFRRTNLLDDDWKLRGPFDAIFCRNVMIYFDKPTQARILERFVPLLRPNGLLFAGHSESLAHVSHLYRLRGKTVYELVKQRSAQESA